MNSSYGRLKVSGAFPVNTQVVHVCMSRHLFLKLRLVSNAFIALVSFAGLDFLSLYLPGKLHFFDR